MLKLAICLLLLAAPPGPAAENAGADEPATLAKARDMALGGRPEDAISLLESLREQAELGEPAATLLGQLYLDADRPEEAYRQLAPLAARPDAGAEALAASGRAALATGRREEGEAWIRRAVELAPDSLAAQAFGIYLGRAERFEEAARVLGPYVEAHPEDRGTALALAMTELKIGATESASATLERLPVDDPGANMLRGEIALSQGQPHRARGFLEKAWASRPGELELDLRRLLGEVYVTTGEAALAIDLLTGYDSGRPDIAILLSRALFEAGDAEAAARALAPFVALTESVGPGSPAADVALAVGIATESGRALIALDRAAEAEGPLRRAARLLPSDPQVWNVLAHALIALGKNDEAREAVVRFHRLSETPLVDD